MLKNKTSAIRDLVGMELTKAHMLLLQATFFTDDRAIDAWRAWHPLIDWEGDPDPVTFRLLPQLQKNLKHRVGIHHLMNKFTGVARKNWFRNQKALLQYHQLLSELSDVNITLGVDAALAITLLNNEIQLDFDRPHRFFIEQNEALLAVKTAQMAGWVLDVDLNERLLPGYLAWHHSALMRNGLNTYIEFSWKRKREEDVLERTSVTPAFLAKLPIYLPSKISSFLEYSTVFSLQPVEIRRTEEAFFSLIANLLLISNAMPDHCNFEILEAALNHNDFAPQVFEAFNLLGELFQEQPDWPVMSHFDRAISEPHKGNQAEGKQFENGYLKRFRRVWADYQNSSFDDLTSGQRLIAFIGYVMARWQLRSPYQLAAKLWRSIKYRF